MGKGKLVLVLEALGTRMTALGGLVAKFNARLGKGMFSLWQQRDPTEVTVRTVAHL